MDYPTALAAYRKAQATLDGWDARLRDPKKFKPVIRCEWDRAFDKRELARDAAQKADPRQFAIDHPQFTWAQPRIS